MEKDILLIITLIIDTMKNSGNCPLCKYNIDPTNVSIKCEKCGYLNEHHNVMFNCDNCYTDLDKMICPRCNKEFTGMLLLGGYKYKMKVLEPFNIPPVDNHKAASFLGKITGEEEFDFVWDEKPKAMMIYKLEYVYPHFSFAEGKLFSISFDTWQHILNSGEFNTVESFEKKYVIGKITIAYGGHLPNIQIKAEPLKL